MQIAWLDIGCPMGGVTGACDNWIGQLGKRGNGGAMAE